METDDSYALKLKSVHELQFNIIKQSLHDLKSPLGGVSGYIELMHVCLRTDGSLSKMERYTEQVERGIEKIDFIVNQLQEVAHQNVDNESEVDASKEDICPLIKDICSQMEGLCKQKKLELEFINLADSIHLEADYFLLQLILLNLIGNAVKYTATHGKIMMKITKTDSTAFISISSKETTRPVKKIKDIFLDELSYVNDGRRTQQMYKQPYYFGIDCIGFMSAGAEISVDCTHGFSVTIQLDLNH